MKLAYASVFDSRDISHWSGTPYHMAQGFQQQGIDVHYIGDLKRKLPPFFKVKQLLSKTLCNQRESPRFNITAARYYSEQADQQLNSLDIQAIVSPQINPIAYLESKKPIILWTDGLYNSLIGFYPGFANHSAQSMKEGKIITQECLSRTTLAIFSSDWAARSATEIYGVSQEKVKVVPFGANITCSHTMEDVKNMIKNRPKESLKLLFLGKHWDRKGGDIVFNVTRALHQAGIRVELNFVGCYPPKDVEIPPYIKCHGFISKRTPEGKAKINELLTTSHFLFVPSRAEAFGIVFCEANAFGLPCLTSHVGGISTIVKNHLNGMTFGLDAPVKAYCDYLSNLMQNPAQYEALALSSFHEYESRLNWTVATKTVKQLIAGCL